MSRVALVALAGAAGTLARYGLGALVQRLGGESFPWGTLAVNVIGCLLFGLFVSMAEHRFPITDGARVVVLVGFMGAFTTFSTLAFESHGFLQDSRWSLMLLHLAAHNLIGVFSIFAGYQIGRVV